MQELKLKRVFPAAYFLKTILPEENVQALLSEKKLSELPDDWPNIFKRLNVDPYMERRPRAVFCNGNYSVLNNFCHAELLA